MKITRISCFGVLFLVVPMWVWAQGLGISNEQIALETRPQIIQPNQPVDITMVSYSTDINRAQVSLYVDGILIQQGVGLKQFSVDAPSVGDVVEVRIIVRTIDQGTITKTLVLNPSQVDLLYEATNSYAPTLYPGKRLPAHEGGVRVVAIPFMVDSTGRKLDPDTLVYTWKVDDQVQVNQSGYGRDTFEFKGSPYYRTRTVSVLVEAVDGLQVANRFIDIPAYDPVIRFYPEHPLWGVDLSDAIIADEPLLLEVPEMVVRSVPFFISDSDSAGLVTYQWNMNGQSMTTFGDRNIINLRAPSAGEGRAQVDLKINHSNKILQIAQSVFTVVFGEQAIERARANSPDNSPNFFGSSN